MRLPEEKSVSFNQRDRGQEETSVSIIIVSWNTRDLLRACLETIRHQAGLKHTDFVETIVVDNCSTDGTVEMLRESYPEIHLIENSDNLGFAQATNQGIRISNGKIILFLNPDTELTEHALSILIDTLKDHPNGGAVGARLIGPDGDIQESAYPSLTLFREFWRLFHLDRIRPFATYPLGKWSYDLPHKVEVVQGACMLVRREALDEVGWLNEDYFMYTEEVDLCYRLLDAGWEIYWEPRAVIIHHGGQSTRQRKSEMFLRLYESKILFFRKHHGQVLTGAYKGVLLLAALSRIVAAWLESLVGSQQQEANRVIAQHYLQLLRRLPSL
jgi:GT2 family glycosyltransferase